MFFKKVKIKNTIVFKNSMETSRYSELNLFSCGILLNLDGCRVEEGVKNHVYPGINKQWE